MEQWELDFYWLKVRHYVQERLSFKSLPDLQAILFLIGIQELGVVREKFTKEEKQDLMHIAVCSLLEEDGYYEFEGRDQDGWPHWKLVRPLAEMSVDEQEVMMKEKIILYFNLMDPKQ